MQTGVPAKPAANVAAGTRLPAQLLVAGAALAVAGTLAWLWLVRWRTGRHRHALWKSLVLPAGGVALCWLLLMTLWLPLLDYARSYRPLIARIARQMPRRRCIAAPGMPRALVVALEHFGRYHVDARHAAAGTRVQAPAGDRRHAQPPVPRWLSWPASAAPTDEESPRSTSARPTALTRARRSARGVDSVASNFGTAGGIAAARAPRPGRPS